MRSLSCLVPLLLAAGPLAAQAHQHTPGMVHGAAAVEPPREAGQAAFAAIAGWFSFYPAHLHCEVAGERVRPQPGGFYGGWMTDDIAGPVKGEPGTGSW